MQTIFAPEGFPVGGIAVTHSERGWVVVRLTKAANPALSIKAQWHVLFTCTTRELAERRAMEVI